MKEKNSITKIDAKVKAKISPLFFEFSSYRFVPEEKKIEFNYRIEFSNRGDLKFTETIVLPRTPNLDRVPAEAVKSALQGVHLVLGMSYYKLYCPPKVKMGYILSESQAGFWDNLYLRGLGEFYYQNKLDPAMSPKFPFDKKSKPKSHALKRSGKILVGVGGGKDSVVAAELLKEQKRDITAFVVETERPAQIISDVIEKIDIGSLRIKRYLDPRIFQKYEGSHNGHIPVSAIFAFLGVLSAILYQYDYVVMANEYSSNFGNLEYRGVAVNHQWSKSAEFEENFQLYVRNIITPSIGYFSLLRPYYEIKIVKMFTKYKKYFPFFSSCNRSYLVKKERSFTLWCGQCPKCVFIFTLLSAFLTRGEAVAIFKKNLFGDESLVPLFADILGLGKVKPFDCVGTFKEAQVALRMASSKFKDAIVIHSLLPKIPEISEASKEVFQSRVAPTVPSEFRLVGAKKVAILGYGREGKITEQYLKKLYPSLGIGIVDKELNPNYLEEQKEYDVAIKTPGMPPHLVKIPYTTATNIFFAEIRKRGNTIIGISGSKGKSTTTSLIYVILRECGLDVQLLGNIGIPMLGALMSSIRKNTIFVLELSSYMLNDLDMSPNVAVVTNLFSEHMDWHGSEEAYYAAKKNIIDFQNNNDYFVYNSNNARSVEWAENARAIAVKFADNIPLPGSDISLLGAHNRDNIKAAIAVAKIFKISNKAIQSAIKRFKPLPHRLELVGVFDGIEFYDDAISTTPQSTIAAIKSMPRKIGTIFLGGQDRGYNFSELEKVIRKLKIENIVLFPDSGKRIFKSQRGLNILETPSMEAAVKFAYSYTPAGHVCLLSTASPSYSVWKDFEEKGDEFQSWVRKLEPTD